MAKEKLSPLKRRTKYLLKGVELVIHQLFLQNFENEEYCLELEKRVESLESKLMKQSH